LYNWKKRYLDKKIRFIGVVDVETGGHGFDANQSHLITWAIKILDLEKNKSKIIYDTIKKSEIIETDKLLKKKERLRVLQPYDKRLLEGLVAEMKKCDFIIGHYSDYFDVPLIRTRCIMLRIPFIRHEDKIRFGDTWKRARFGMKFIRNSLDQVGRSFNLPVTKTKFDRWVWDQATYHGEKWALDKILDHNIKDVEITYAVWKLAESNFSIPAKYQ
jgi:DNA polymerase elongation subunit (family B)